MSQIEVERLRRKLMEGLGLLGLQQQQPPQPAATPPRLPAGVIQGGAQGPSAQLAPVVFAPQSAPNPLPPAGSTLPAAAPTGAPIVGVMSPPRTLALGSQATLVAQPTPPLVIAQPSGSDCRKRGRARSSYTCSRCGQPKKGHSCIGTADP